MVIPVEDSASGLRVELWTRADRHGELSQLLSTQPELADAIRQELAECLARVAAKVGL